MSVLQMSVSAGLLVAAIVIIRAVALNRLPKTTFLILWGVVLLRLLVPVSIPSPFNVFISLNGPWNAPAPVSAQNSVPAAAPVIAHGLQADAGGVVAAAEQAAGWSLTPIMIVWLSGMLMALIFFAVIYVKNYRELRSALVIDDDDFLNAWLAEHTIKRPVRLLRSDRIATPVAAGIIHPRIILPKAMDMADRELLRYVLAHESCHIRRWDTLWKLLLVITVCIHWFNPMVWIMFVLFNRDLELTCDETVIRRFGAETKAAYAYSIIGMAKQRSKFTPLHNGFSKNAAEERIVSIMQCKKSTSAAVLLAVLLVVGTTTAFVTSPWIGDTEAPSQAIVTVNPTPFAPSPPEVPSVSGTAEEEGERNALYEDNPWGCKCRWLGECLEKPNPLADSE